ncbi:MAG TPA: hypothetical protein VFH73_24245 [Polyangia bacterium]|jgi:hypothetical protein|nr:hypothetical protein [Polyangia bacterium]
MRTLEVLVLALGLGATSLTLTTPAAAAKAKAKSGGAAPTATAEEVNKLKAVRLGDPKAGTFKWGNTSDEVLAQVTAAVEKKYQPTIEAAAQDPGKQQRIRGEMEKELNAITSSYTKFEGQKSGWDVSIIGPEFQQKTGEAVIVAKEEVWTRYFFFYEGALYKMFLAFNRDAIEGKSFRDFGKEMEGKYGKAREVYRDEKTKTGVRRLLDHFEWNAGPDKLKLVDRSEFYGVFCLILFDGKVSDRVMAKRKIVNPEQSRHDALVEAVTAKDKSDRDSNDNIVDRLTGKEIKKPGEERHGDIVVPSPSASSPASSASPSPSASSPAPAATEPPKTYAPPPTEKVPAAAPSTSSSGNKKGKGKKGGVLDGLDL